jgi:lysophospholipase L1-like esterase
MMSGPRWSDSDRTVQRVACLGSSSTAARGTYNWIAELEKRPQNRRFRFVNLGVGGDLSFNTCTRVAGAIKTRPDRVIVLVGANDILASVFPNFHRFAERFKGLSQAPSVQAFRNNLVDIAQRLRDETSAQIALSSLAPVGEDADSDDPTQAKLNRLFAAYSRVTQEVASDCGAYYIAFYERFVAALRDAAPHKCFNRLSFPALYRDYLFREFVQRRTFDEIARINGWQFHIDGIHLNTAGGSILVEAVQGFLDI